MSGNILPHLRIRNTVRRMKALSVAQAASFLDVSDDTVRRWIEQGTLTGHKDSAGYAVVDGAELAAYARDNAVSPQDPAGVNSSARNRLVGLVTKVTADRSTLRP